MTATSVDSTPRRVLLLAASALMSIALVLLTLRLATSRRVLSALVLRRPIDEPSERRFRIGNAVRRRPLLAAGALFAAGVATLALVTPPNNVVLRSSGGRSVGPVQVGPNTSASVLLAREPFLYTKAP